MLQTYTRVCDSTNNYVEFRMDPRFRGRFGPWSPTVYTTVSTITDLSTILYPVTTVLATMLATAIWSRVLATVIWSRMRWRIPGY